MPYEPLGLAEKKRIGWMALALEDALLIGNAPPHSQAMWERSRAPQAGDWVVEMSTLGALLVRGLDEDDRWDGQVTRFLRTETRTHTYDGGQTWSEEVQVCENPDGTEFTWTNCRLMVVPLTGRLVPIGA